MVVPPEGSLLNGRQAGKPRQDSWAACALPLVRAHASTISKQHKQAATGACLLACVNEEQIHSGASNGDDGDRLCRCDQSVAFGGHYSLLRAAAIALCLRALCNSRVVEVSQVRHQTCEPAALLGRSRSDGSKPPSDARSVTHTSSHVP